MWFEKLTGFQEKSPEYIREHLIVEGNDFISKVNDKRLTFGTLEIPTLGELKAKCPNLDNYEGAIEVREIVADVQTLHVDTQNKNALFQAASQFNLLEMISPNVTPEQGIDGYEFDHTQGPACAIACGAGTIYRNYFVPIKGQLGQTKNHQINCLDLIGKALENDSHGLWTMKNGYFLTSREHLDAINQKLAQRNKAEREQLKAKLKTGIQWNTEVTISASKHKVSQIYCSALPVAYNPIASKHWESFARIILEATYEACLYAAVLNMENNKSNKVFLTWVGGGAFGNPEHWILESLLVALQKFKQVPLDIRMVSYGQSNPRLIDVLKNI